jgi:predicted DNA-binding transcriptional regulator YafY
MGTITVSTIPVGAIVAGAPDHVEGQGGLDDYVYLSQEDFDDGACTLVSVPSDEPDATWNSALIELAIKFERTITFQYAKGTGSYIETRRLAPDALHAARDGSQNVIGYDPDRQDVRAYRLDRIKGDVSA